jgi:hypothetical protein
VTAEFVATASRAFPATLTPAPVALPPPEPGHTKERETPLATATIKARSSSSALEAALLGLGTVSTQVIAIRQ